jgi:hypothetical protein
MQRRSRGLKESTDDDRAAFDEIFCFHDLHFKFSLEELVNYMYYRNFVHPASYFHIIALVSKLACPVMSTIVCISYSKGLFLYSSDLLLILSDLLT